MISVVVPVFNEAANVPPLLVHLGHLQRQGAQVVVVDGGSTDDTCALLAAGGFAAHAAGRGRANQMNAGAALATQPVLLFLHADTALPERAIESVMHGLQGLQSGALRPRCWGRFDVRIEGQSRWLVCVSGFMNLRSRVTGIATGDQAMFMTRRAFDAVRGFEALPLMEDISMSARLKRLSPPVCLRAKAVTSGRRWDSNGVWRTIWLMWRLRWAYWRGADPAVLAKAYR